MFRFTLPPGHKMGAACARYGHRYSFTEALLAPTADPATAVLACCDGRILAVLPVTVDVAPAAGVPTSFLPAVACNSNGRPLTVDVNGEVRISDGKKTSVHALVDMADGRRYPALRDALPASLDGYTALALDVGHLARLANAVSSEGELVLLVPPAGKDGEVHKPVPVVGLADGVAQGAGCIMPLTCDTGKARDRYLFLRGLLPEGSVRVDPVPPPADPS